MLYRPTDGKLWDTLLAVVEGKVHLLHLRAQQGLGHALSEDWLHWTPLANIPAAGKEGSWNEGFGPWTGCLVSHEGRWHLFIGGQGPDGICAYGFLVSEDLEHWRDELGRAVLKPDPRWYQREPSSMGPMHAAWRDPCILRDRDGLYHAFLCARRPGWSAQDTGACVAHATSADLIDWQYHPPIAELGKDVLFAEVPDVFRIGDWWYLLLLDHKWGGVGVEQPGRQSPAGTFYLKSRSMTGPYTWPEKPLLIGCDDDQVGPWAARTLLVDDQRWLYFHHNARHSALAVPKRIVQGPEGDLHLQRLGLLESLGSEVKMVQPPRALCELDSGQWEPAPAGFTGRAEAAGSSVVVARDLCDLQLACTLRGQTCRKVGVVVRSAGGAGESFFQQGRSGIAVWLDFHERRVLARKEVYVPGLGWGRAMGDQMGKRPWRRRSQQAPWPLDRDQEVRLRLELRDAFLEVYLDETWVLSCTLDEHLHSGDVECTIEAGTGSFENLDIRELPPMATSSQELDQRDTRESAQ
jgi:hypothetical protein